MKRALAYAFCAVLGLGGGAAAQDANKKDSGGLLVRLLEDNLSGDNRNIKVTGLSGALSGRATIERLTVSDDAGIWLTIEDAVLDWNRLALVRGRFSVNELSADEIIVARAPNPTENPELPSPEAQPFSLPELPVAIEIEKLAAGRLELGEDLMGRAAVLSLEGSLNLADGALDADLSARRLDKQTDSLTLDASYSNETRVIGVDLDFREESGGLVATLLRVPGAPPMRLNVQGSGPVTDFRANIALASDGENRLAGVVTLRGDDAPTPTESDADDAAGAATPDAASAIAFGARLNGDIRPLLEPAFHDFFGADTALDLSGRRSKEGALEIERFDLASGALDLNGSLRLSAEGAPEFAELAGSIAPPAGQYVVLPVPGGDTTVGAVNLDGALNGQDDSWRLTLTANDFSHPAARLGRTDLRADGRIIRNGGFRIDGTLRAALRGIALTDPDLDRAMGDAVTLNTGFSTPGDGTFEVSGLSLRGAGLDATADAAIAGLDTGYRIDGNATVKADSLARFSGLAGRPLGGAIDARLSGNAAPLWGQFDLRLDAAADGLSSGIEQVDELIDGRSTLVLDAARDETGLSLRHFEIETPAIAANADGVVRSDGSDLNFDLVLDELGRILPQAPGRLTASGRVSQADGVISGRGEVRGPNDSRATLDGSFTPDSGDAKLTYDATVNRIERFVSELSGTVTSTGTARRDGMVWTVDSKIDAPANTNARVTGTWDQDANRADLKATGGLRLGVVNRIISPMSIDGAASFDLTVKGPPALNSVAGTVTTSGTSVAIPQIGNALTNVNGTVSLGSGQAQLALNGGVRSGGGFRTSGPVSLTAPFSGTITTELNAIKLTDSASYDTVIDGQLAISGPLATGPTLSGRIVVGETNFNIAAGGGAPGTAPIPDNIIHIGESAAQRATRARAGLIKTDTGGSSLNIGLDVEISAPNRIFVRGRGLQAELGGALYVGGSTANVVPSGSIDLIRGTLELFGNRLDLTKGNVTLQGRLVPFIDFAATNNTNSGQSTLRIAGPLSQPEVTVESSPARPPEEALAMLVFGDNFTELSPIKLAQMAAAFARLAGSGGGTTESLRNGLGVDSLNLGVDENGNAEVGAGAYIAEDVYTDVTVNTQGQTELHLNFDVNENVTIRGSADNEGETGLGVFFKRDY